MAAHKQAVSNDTSFESTPTARLAIAWAVVGIPLLYGVIQVFIKSLALFG